MDLSRIIDRYISEAPKPNSVVEIKGVKYPVYPAELTEKEFMQVCPFIDQSKITAQKKEIANTLEKVFENDYEGDEILPLNMRNENNYHGKYLHDGKSSNEYAILCKVFETQVTGNCVQFNASAYNFTEGFETMVEDGVIRDLSLKAKNALVNYFKSKGYKETKQLPFEYAKNLYPAAWRGDNNEGVGVRIGLRDFKKMKYDKSEGRGNPFFMNFIYGYKFFYAVPKEAVKGMYVV